MSQENVDLILGFPLFLPGVDVVALTNDAEQSARMTAAVSEHFHEDFECVFPNLLGDTTTYVGFEGLRTAWLDWLAPWDSYRIVMERGVDCGDRVLTFYDVFATARGTTGEVKLSGADVWTLRDGKVARWEGYPSRRAALRAVGLEDG